MVFRPSIPSVIKVCIVSHITPMNCNLRPNLNELSSLNKIKEYREFAIYICTMNEVDIFKALSNKTRLQILNWLKEPRKNFPEQEANGFADGVCVGQIQKKAGLTQSTVSEYLAILQRAGLVKSTRVGQWTYYQRDEAAFEALSKHIKSNI
jgi:DNA-binding transcriptional ArsR family regulator